MCTEVTHSLERHAFSAVKARASEYSYGFTGKGHVPRLEGATYISHKYVSTPSVVQWSSARVVSEPETKQNETTERTEERVHARKFFRRNRQSSLPHSCRRTVPHVDPAGLVSDRTLEEKDSLLADSVALIAHVLRFSTLVPLSEQSHLPQESFGVERQQAPRCQMNRWQTNTLKGCNVMHAPGTLPCCSHWS